MRQQEAGGNRPGKAGTAVKASVIIPTFNRPEPLARTLGVIVREMRQLDFPVECIVVDDGTTGAAARRVRDAAGALGTVPGWFERHAVNRGVSSARNTGASLASGEILIFLDDDVVPSSHFIREHVQVHGTHDNALIICGHLFTKHRSAYGRFWARCYDRVFCQPGQGRDFYPVNMLSSNNFSIKRAVRDKIHPLFDPDLPSREDFDLFLRARDAGVIVYKTRRAAAENTPRSTLSAFVAQGRWYARGEERLRAKHGTARVVAAEKECRMSLTRAMRLLLLLARIQTKSSAQAIPANGKRRAAPAARRRAPSA